MSSGELESRASCDILETKEIELAREVGGFSYKALQYAKTLVKPGAKLADVADNAEKFAWDNGFGCAFPINLSINQQAAHYTPTVGDEIVFTDNDVVKVDFGLSKDGILGDCALTVDLSGKHAPLVEATEDALREGIGAVRAGVKVSAVGGAIEKAIVKHGFLPVKNLGGHGVAKHDLHSHPFIPNYDNGDEDELEEDTVVAIEPFATTDTVGMITESNTCEIYEFAGEAPVRLPNGRTVLKVVMEKYGSEPFAVRWLMNDIKDRFVLYSGIGELVRSGALVAHPMLTTVGKGIVSQAEAQVLVTKDGCEVLTK
jgi:methionyl aminopeptidase